MTIYRCRKCGREFPVVAWIETSWVPSPPPSTESPFTGRSEYEVTTTIRKPCCPFCHEIEIELVKEAEE